MNKLSILYDPDDLTQVPWSRQDDEPVEEFEWFQMYYLALGPSRSLRKAFIAYLSEKSPERLGSYLENPGTTLSARWTTACKEWDWRRRAREHDRMLTEDSRKLVDEARKLLFDNAVEAVEALTKALNNPRSQVAAAKEILNRVGLPAVTELSISAQPYTTDELNRATEEVDEWEKQLLLTETSSEKSG